MTTRPAVTRVDLLGRTRKQSQPQDVLANRLRSAMFEHMRIHGKSSRRDLVRITKSPSTVDWHLRKMVQAGIVRRIPSTPRDYFVCASHTAPSGLGAASATLSRVPV